MYAENFEYDGRLLSDYGCIICTFGNSSGIETVDTGANIALTTVSRHNGKRRGLIAADYSGCIKATFYICKNPCASDDASISPTEYREMTKWLNRRQFLKMRFLSLTSFSPDPCYFNAMFNIQKITVGDRVVGLELSMETDSPFGYGAEINQTVIPDYNTQDFIDYISDEIGYMYPKVRIVPLEAGDLKITNSLCDGEVIITNCSASEIILMDGDTQTLRTNLSSHDIYDCFNYEFIKLVSNLDNDRNIFTASLPCSLTFTYCPIIRDIPL